MKVCLILSANIGWSNFLNHPAIKSLSEKGLTFNFQKFFPLEPKTAFTYVLTGCNPGKAGPLDITDNPLRFKESKGFEQTIMSLLLKEGFSVEYLVNNLPNGNTDFSFVYLDDFKLLDNILDIVQTKGIYVFIIVPICEEYVQKAININNFLKEKEIIETDTEGAIIWENSLAYQKGYGQLWINLIGRDPKGAVSPGEEYDEVREALIKGITEKLIDDENKQPVVERIYKKEDLFNGENLLRMPDLIVILKQGFGFSHLNDEPIFDTSTILRKKCEAYTAGSGIILGENIRKNRDFKDLAITSIAPSILYCMGCTIPAWMDGKVEEQLFSKDFVSGNSPKYDGEQGASILSKEDEALIKERLKGLGYLE